MSAVDGVTALDAAHVPDKTSTETITGPWNFSLPPGGVIGEGTTQLTFITSTEAQLGRGSVPLKVGSTWMMQRSTGAILSNTGLTAATLYYIYAKDVAGTLTLSVSTSTHKSDTGAAGWGVEIMATDDTKSLVGMVYAGAGAPGTFVDSTSARTLASWFQKRQRAAVSPSLGMTRSTTSTSFVELSTADRVAWVQWANEVSDLSAHAHVFSTDGAQGGWNIFIDGVSQAGSNTVYFNSTAVPTPPTQQSAFYADMLSEGYHQASPGGYTSSGKLSEAGPAGVRVLIHI